MGCGGGGEQGDGGTTGGFSWAVGESGGEVGRLPPVPMTPAGPACPGDVPIPCSLMYRCWRISAWLSWQDVWDENVSTLFVLSCPFSL